MEKPSSTRDVSTDMKLRRFSQKYADNTTNNSDRRSRAKMLQACQDSLGICTKFRAGIMRQPSVPRLSYS